MKEIARESTDPIVLFRNCMIDLKKYDLFSATKKFLGDSHGIHHMIGFYYGYDDMVENPRYKSCNGKYGTEGINELKKEMIKAAKTWLEEYKSLLK